MKTVKIELSTTDIMHIARILFDEATRSEQKGYEKTAIWEEELGNLFLTTYEINKD